MIFQTIAGHSSGKPWPVKLLTWLLLVQSLGLTSLSLSPFFSLKNSKLNTLLTLLQQYLNDFNIWIIILLIAGLSIFVTFTFWRTWRIAWSAAILLQGLCLLVSINLYLNATLSPPYLVYISMIYTIFLVIYLHHSEVQIAFDLHTKGDISL